jgi:hypothetical protein
MPVTEGYGMREPRTTQTRKMRTTRVAGTEVHSGDAAEFVCLAQRLRAFQRGDLWEQLLATAAGLVVVLVMRNPEAPSLVADKPGEGAAICVAISENVATLYVHDCTYLIESEAAWTVLAPRGIWIPPLRPVVTLIAEAERLLHAY